MPAVVTWWRNLLDPNGREETFAAWEELFDRFERVEPFRGQDEHPGWTPARFNPCCRAKDNVRSVFAVCLDYDGGETIDAAEGLWGGLYGLIHTSRKHTATAHRFRVVLPLARPVSPFEFGELWKRLNHQAGGKLDPAPKDPSRFWFCPGIPDSPDAEYVTRRLTGTVLDPDTLLAQPLPAARQVGEPPRIAVSSETNPYVRAAFEDEIYGVQTAAAGTRNQRLNQAAFSLGQFVGAGAIQESSAWDSLREAARACGLGAREIEATIASGVEAGKKHPRVIPESTRRAVSPPVAVTPPKDPDPQPEVAPKEPARGFGLLSMVDLMQLVIDELKKPKPNKGAKTGSANLDEAIGGFRPGNVTVFGAKRGFGKTSYGNLVTNLGLNDGVEIALFAGEDAAMMYGKRFLAMRADLNAMLLRDFRVRKEDWQRIYAALAEAPKNPFFARVDGRPVEWIAAAIESLSKERQLGLVIVDYLQCLKTAKRCQDRRNEVTHICKTLSDAIKKANAAGLVFSQLKRTERLEPEVEDLKESGDIEDMADHIVLGWKVELENESAKRWMKLGKNKDGLDPGEVCHWEMPFDNKTAAFNQQYKLADARDDFNDLDAGYDDYDAA